MWSLGLTQIEAARRLSQYGPNTLAQAHQRSTLAIFLAQFRSLIVALLVAATVIAFAVGDTIEAVAILVVIVINAGIGFFTEWKAEQALSALQKQSVRLAHVIRDGAERRFPQRSWCRVIWSSWQPGHESRRWTHRRVRAIAN